jgi:hypothetical protein
MLDSTKRKEETAAEPMTVERAQDIVMPWMPPLEVPDVGKIILEDFRDMVSWTCAEEGRHPGNPARGILFLSPA